MVLYFSKLPEYEVHAVAHLKKIYPVNGVVWHRANLRDSSRVKNVVSGMDIVVQCAATTSGSADIVNTPAIHVTDNAVMNSLIFRAATEAGVKHVIFPSCTVMYGSSDMPQDESAPISINPKYFGVAHTKLYCEKLCEFYANLPSAANNPGVAQPPGTKFTAIRHSNCYGPYDKYDLQHSHVFGASVAKVMNFRDTVMVWGSGEETRDLLYVDDLCSFVHKAIDNQPSKYALYNCGLGSAISIKDLVYKIIAASGKHLTVQHDLSAPTIKTSLCLDYGKAAREIGWHPKISLDQGVVKTLRWYEGSYANRA